MRRLRAIWTNEPVVSGPPRNPARSAMGVMPSYLRPSVSRGRLFVRATESSTAKWTHRAAAPHRRWPPEPRSYAAGRASRPWKRWWTHSRAATRLLRCGGHARIRRSSLPHSPSKGGRSRHARFCRCFDPQVVASAGAQKVSTGEETLHHCRCRWEQLIPHTCGGSSNSKKLADESGLR
jgi:hypothetical protein